MDRYSTQRFAGSFSFGALDLLRPPAQLMGIMDFSETELVFLRDVVKTARQKPNYVTWTDRDGSERHSVFAQPEFVQLATLAGRHKVGKGELLRRAAHIPMPKPAVG